MPGKFSSFHEDFSQLVSSGPKVVVTCATTVEMIDCSANPLPQKLQNLEIKWFQLAVDDFQVPDENNEEKWNSVRNEWGAVYNKKQSLTLNSSVNGKKLYEYLLFSNAYDEKEKHKELIESFLLK